MLKNSDTVLFYDGSCGFCDRWVSFILKHERNNRTLFCQLESDRALKFLRPLSQKIPSNTLILWADNQLLYKSDAVMKLLTQVKPPYSVLSFFKFIPRFMRDACYDLVARNRYRIMGRKDSCDIPSPEQRKRFL